MAGKGSQKPIFRAFFNERKGTDQFVQVISAFTLRYYKDYVTGDDQSGWA